MNELRQAIADDCAATATVTSDGPAVPSVSIPKLRAQVFAVGLIAVVCLLLAVWQWRTLASEHDTYESSLTQLARMRADAQAIQTLCQAPQSAVSRTRPHEAILAQVEQALSAAGIERNRWQDSLPHPPSRIARSDYVRHATSLYFTALPMTAIAGFVHGLETLDPTLSVSTVSLSSGSRSGMTYDVDVAISYLMYAPADHLVRSESKRYSRDSTALPPERVLAR